MFLRAPCLVIVDIFIFKARAGNIKSWSTRAILYITENSETELSYLNAHVKATTWFHRTSFLDTYNFNNSIENKFKIS